MTRDSFVFYKSWKDAMGELPNDIRLEVYESIIRYACGETVEGLKPLARVAFSFIKQDIDRMRDNEIAFSEKQSKNGAKGGAKKGNQNAKKQPKTTQNNPNKLNDNDNVNVNTVEPSEEGSMSDCEQSDPAIPQNGSQHVSIDFKKLICWFNETTSGVFGTIKYPIGEKRKKMLRARISEHGKQSFVEMVNKAVYSDFLRGQNERDWTATFDWLIRPANYEKVLSDNFKNKKNGTNQRNDKSGTKRPTFDELGAAVEIGFAIEAANKNRG